MDAYLMRCVFVISLLLDTNPQCRNVSIWHLADILLTQSGHQSRLKQTNEWVCIQKKDRRAAVFRNKVSLAKA